MFGILKKLTRRMVLTANIIVILVMLLSAYSDYIDPREHILLSNMGLVFPVLLAVNAAFLVFWLVMFRRYALCTLLGFLLCLGSIRTYMPVNLPSKPPKDAIKILSYNVYMFAPWNLAPGEPNPIVEYILKSDADIICLQESAYDIPGRERIDSAFSALYQYRDTAMKSASTNDMLTLYSRFPIVHRERVNYSSRGNLSEAYVLDINGEHVLLINNHFESNALSNDDKDKFKSMVKGTLSRDDSKRESKNLLGKLGAASQRRAPQVDAVAKIVRKYQAQGMSVILCGDFNDNPISYTRRQMANMLNDCYVATGNGPGWSYHKSGMYVRIDNILCSDDWKPYGAKVDRSVNASDHYPIYCWLKKRLND